MRVEVTSPPGARIASSTSIATCSICSSLTDRPFDAARTPKAILSRSNGWVEPSDLTTVNATSSSRSKVVKRYEHDRHWRRRRTAAPSSASRESTTLVSSA